jgi:hypothetical protein
MTMFDLYDQAGYHRWGGDDQKALVAYLVSAARPPSGSCELRAA